MAVNDPGDPLLPPPKRGRHRSARERQRKGPMWGCLKALMWLFAGIALLLVILVGGGWWYLGSTSFEGLIRARIETTLQNRLGREVHIGSVEVIRTRPQKVILNDIRVANAPGGAAKYFATVRQVEIAGGIESFWQRHVKIGRIDIRDPRLFFEILPNGQHNFPRWKSGPRRGPEIVHVDLGKMFVTGGFFSFNDRKHDIAAVAERITSEMTVTRAEDLYAGVMNSPFVRVRIQDYNPFDVTLRGGFRYTPGVLALQSIALQGNEIEAFVSGELNPLTQGVYDLEVRSRLTLQRIAQIFKVDQKLEGPLVLDTRLRGKQGDFTLSGGWVSPHITALDYELDDVEGKLNVTGTNVKVRVDKATYAGGNIAADYTLSQYAEPYPMTVDLDYDRISIEQLFNDFGVEGTGLRGAATGSLVYRWNKDKLLAGSGEGNAQLARNATAFSDARYPIPVSGSTDFALDNGTITFRNTQLDTEASQIALNGTLRIEDLLTDFRTSVNSRDFAELDRIGYNFAHAADKTDYELLGLGGAGTITGSITGPLKSPVVVAQINATNARYNEVLLGNADIALRYDGPKSTLTFERAVVTDANGRMAFSGTVAFPDSGPSPRFDIAVDATNYPAQRAIDAVGLDFKIGEGLATGRMVVAGTPESGRVSFAGLTIRRRDAELRLTGDVQWVPGEGNVRFGLDINARNFPVADLISFLDLGALPVSGNVTGQLAISGPKSALEGRGSVTVREGVIYGEPIDLASADIAFEQGRMRATNVLVQSPAGEVRGEAEFDMATERFSYTITSSNIDLSRLKLLEGIRGLLGGNVTLTSTGAGTMDNPELMIEATLNQATLKGLTLPPDAAPPKLYIAIRGGRLIVKGSVADIINIDGEGTVGENLAVDGLVRIAINDVARALQLSPTTASLPAEGQITLDLRLGGRLSPMEALVIDATAPVFNVSFAGNAFTTPSPLHIVLREGRINFESVTLAQRDSSFAVTGFAEISGGKRVDVDVRGRVDATLLQLFVPDMRAEGQIDVVAGLEGTFTSPRLTGTAQINNAEVRFAGFPQVLDDITGTLRFNGDRIEVEAVRATLGGGTVIAGGFIDVDGFTPKNARITLQGTDVAIRYYEGLTLEGNFNLLLSGGLERATLTGDVNVTRALWFREFDIQQSLLNIILSRRGITPVTTASWQDNVILRVHLSAPDTLAVRNNIADVTGSAELDVTGTLANPVILGEVTLAEGGTVRVQNVDYRLVRGTIAFQNPFRIDPFFDVTIEGTVSGNVSETEGGPIEVTVNITGTLDRITPTITSDPPASDITLFSILGFGGITGSGRTGQTAGAGFAGRSLLYQSLFSYLGSAVLPFVDSFAYDPGLLDAGAGVGGKVTFEKRLSDRLRFLLVYNLDNQQSRQVIEWLVNRDWTLQLTRDESDEYRMDARFRRRYEAQWTWGDRGRGELAAFGTLRGGEAVTQAVAPAPPTTTVRTDAFDGVPVAEINFRADALFDTSTLGQYVALKTGQPIATRDVQSSIKNLFSTGNFRDVRVDAAQGPNGLAVTFSLIVNYRIGDIDITGLERRDRTRAQRDLTVRTGEVLSLDDVDDSANAVQQYLRRIGFLEATVDPETTFNRERSLAEVTFHVNAGPLAKVAEVLIEGDTKPFTTAQLIERMDRGPGKVFHLPEARSDADRMKNWLVRRDHRRADVDFLGHTYDPQAKTVTLRYRATAGPKVRVEVAGIDRRAVRRWLPFRGRNQEYSEDIIDQAAEDIRRGLQQRGHYNAAVDTESRLLNGEWVTTFEVRAGQRYRLADVEFEGNQQLEDRELERVIATSPRGGFRRILSSLFRRPTGITGDQLSADRDSLESYYRLQGFGAATVGTPAVNTLPNGTMVVVFPVNEGAQSTITEVRIEGNEQVAADDLPRLQLKPGDPLNPQLLHEDTVALQTFYADRGNVEVQVSTRVVPEEGIGPKSVTFVIAEGPRVEIADIVVRGNTYTDSEVILRRSDLDPGDPFSYTSILEAQRELYRLGIFSRVDIQPEQAGTTVADRNVVISVEEGRNLTLTGAIGLRVEREQAGSGGRGAGEPAPEPEAADGKTEEQNRVQPRLAIAAAHRNLFGTGRYLGLEAVISQTEKEFFITYREPFLSRFDVPVQVQVFQTDDNTRPGTHILQRGTSIEATRVARERTRWSLRYEYKISECRDGFICDELNDPKNPEEPIEGLDPSLRNIQISSIQPTFFWDSRDDIIDPHRGFFTSASVEYAFPLFSAEANFLKTYVQGAWYLPLSSRTVVALSGRLGLINPMGGTAHGDVPLSERFTAGGETTHRAYGLDLLGDLCRDENNVKIEGCTATLFREDPDSPILPIGGSGLFLMNAEYRFPVFGPVGGAVFVDAGNVYPDAKINFDELRYGAGVGIRYLSPVGPLRFDIGWPLERRHFDRSFSYFITLGYAF